MLTSKLLRALATTAAAGALAFGAVACEASVDTEGEGGEEGGGLEVNVEGEGEGGEGGE